MGDLRGVLLSTLAAAPAGAWLGARAWRLSAETLGAAGAPALPAAVTALCLWAGAVAAGWHALTGLACLALRAAAGAGHGAAALEAAIRRWGFPLLRRAVVASAAAGAGAALGLAPAAAEPAPVPADLGWGAAAPGPAEEPDPQTHRVGPGDSLWTIASEHLGEDADPAAVAEAWPRWYEANRAAIGPDPGLIHPGLALQVPDDVPSAHEEEA